MPVALSAFPASGKIDVEQGNIVTTEMVDQPAGHEPAAGPVYPRHPWWRTLQPDRWDYPYVKRNGMDVLNESRLTVYFDGDNLVRYDGDVEVDHAASEVDKPEADDS